MDTPAWVKMFCAKPICRQDLVTAGCSKEYVETLTDEQMEQIAEKIGNYIEDYYFDKGFWEELKKFAEEPGRPYA